MSGQRSLVRLGASCRGKEVGSSAHLQAWASWNSSRMASCEAAACRLHHAAECMEACMERRCRLGFRVQGLWFTLKLSVGCRQRHTSGPGHQAHRIGSQAAVSKRHTACRACSPCSLWRGQDQCGDMLSTTLHGLQGIDKAVIEAVFYDAAQAHPLLLLSRVVEGDVVGEDDLLVLARHPGNDQRDLQQSPCSRCRCHQLPDDLASDKHPLVSEALCELSLLAERNGRTATWSSTLAAARVGLAAQSQPPAAAALQPSHVWQAFKAYGLHVLRPDRAPAHSTRSS